MKTAARAAAWAAVGSLVGVLAWSTLAASLMPIYFPPQRWWEALVGWPWAFLGSAFWAAFVGAAALPVYTLLLAGWLAARRRWPGRRGLGDARLAALTLGTPLALLVVWSFADTAGFPFRWDEAGRMLPIALPSCWLAVAVPPRVLAGVRAALGSPAA